MREEVLAFRAAVGVFCDWGVFGGHCVGRRGRYASCGFFLLMVCRDIYVHLCHMPSLITYIKKVPPLRLSGVAARTPEDPCICGVLWWVWGSGLNVAESSFMMNAVCGTAV